MRSGVGRVFLIHSVETGKVRELSPDLKDFNVHSLRWSADGRFLLGAGKTKDVFWGVLKIGVETRDQRQSFLPYEWFWWNEDAPYPEGDFTITAAATDDDGAVGVSPEIVITVHGPE